MALSKYDVTKQYINKAKIFLGRHPKEVIVSCMH